MGQGLVGRTIAGRLRRRDAQPIDRVDYGRHGSGVHGLRSDQLRCGCFRGPNGACDFAANQARTDGAPVVYSAPFGFRH